MAEVSVEKRREGLEVLERVDKSCPPWDVCGQNHDSSSTPNINDLRIFTLIPRSESSRCTVSLVEEGGMRRPWDPVMVDVDEWAFNAPLHALVKRRGCNCSRIVGAGVREGDREWVLKLNVERDTVGDKYASMSPSAVLGPARGPTNNKT